MEDVQIIFVLLWACLMLICLWGIVFSVLAGDARLGELGGKKIRSSAWFGITVIQLIPIVMVVLSVILQDNVNQWANIGVAGFFFVFNLAGLQETTIARLNTQKEPV